jgi:hypothetical protein
MSHHAVVPALMQEKHVRYSLYGSRWFYVVRIRSQCGIWQVGYRLRPRTPANHDTAVDSRHVQRRCLASHVRVTRSFGQPICAPLDRSAKNIAHLAGPVKAWRQTPR